jgi:acetyl/propionyl-CoA carboxylase alpha subunit
MATVAPYLHSLVIPLVMKQTAGGRGLGIHYVSSPSELACAIKSAHDEARRSFDDPTVFLERLIDGAYQVEVQIIADNYGTTWAVGVRNSIVQHHGQKILEESGSPVLLPEQERELCQAAVRLCQLANYQSAGSVEFLYDPIQHTSWFLEPCTALRLAITRSATGGVSGTHAEVLACY